MNMTQTKTADLKQQVFARHRTGKSHRKTGPKSTTVAAYTGVFLLVISMVAIGYQPPQKVDKVANAVNPLSSTSATPTDQPSVDQIIATNIAADIATRADLPVAANIANQSISLSIQGQLAQSDSNTISKPQIIQPSADNRTIKQYTTKDGDTVDSIAAQFNISSDTVKWANSLTTNSVAAGKDLKILPVDGVLYTVKNGDTIDSIASKFNTTAQNITVYNDLELSGLVPGKQVILPSGILPTNERPGYQAPQVRTLTSSFSSYRYANGFAGGSGLGSWVNTKSTTSGNTNAWGNCTWWAWERRYEMGMALPSGALGNAREWSYTLGQAGHLVDSVPSYGAVFQSSEGYYGHVGVVEVVNADGSIVVSEMNNYSLGGYNIVDKRVIPASAVGSFNYIH
jgi:surface antigen/phage tail protein X